MSREEAIRVIQNWLDKLSDPENQHRQIHGYFTDGSGKVCALGLDNEINDLYTKEMRILQGSHLKFSFVPFDDIKLIRALRMFDIDWRYIARINDDLKEPFCKIAVLVQNQLEEMHGPGIFYPKVRIKKELANQTNQTNQTSRELINA